MIPTPYISKESAIASYNYTDIADGTGVVEFMAAEIAVSGAYVYKLVSNAGIYSDGRLGYSVSNAFDEDFDVTFSRSQIIGGNLFLLVPLAYYAESGSTHEGHITAKIIHYDGTTETIIGAEVTSPTYGSAQSDWLIWYSCLQFTIKKTHFKAGDTLRINIIGTDSGGTGGLGYIGHSPVSQGTGTGEPFEGGTSRLSVFVPFVIDV